MEKAVSAWTGELWERGLEEHIAIRRSHEKSDASCKSCSEALRATGEGGSKQEETKHFRLFHFSGQDQDEDMSCRT